MPLVLGYRRCFREDASKIQTIADDLRFDDGLFDGTVRRGRSDSRLYHRPVGLAIECDELEDPPFAHNIDNAIHLAPGLPSRARDKPRGQASIVVVLRGFSSKRDLDIFEELLPLGLRKTNDQPGEARQ